MYRGDFLVQVQDSHGYTNSFVGLGLAVLEPAAGGASVGDDFCQEKCMRVATWVM